MRRCAHGANVGFYPSYVAFYISVHCIYHSAFPLVGGLRSLILTWSVFNGCFSCVHGIIIWLDSLHITIDRNHVSLLEIASIVVTGCVISYTCGILQWEKSVWLHLILQYNLLVIWWKSIVISLYRTSDIGASALIHKMPYPLHHNFN